MHPIIIVFISLVLFVAGMIGGFIALHAVTKKVIGFLPGLTTRTAVSTAADAKSRRRHRTIWAVLLLAVKVLSVIAFVLLGVKLWSYFALAPCIGLGLGISACFYVNKDSLLPHGWERKK